MKRKPATEQQYRDMSRPALATIEAWRKANGLTMTAVAERLGCVQSAYSAWARGKVIPNMPFVAKLVVLANELRKDMPPKPSGPQLKPCMTARTQAAVPNPNRVTPQPVYRSTVYKGDARVVTMRCRECKSEVNAGPQHDLASFDHCLVCGSPKITQVTHTVEIREVGP